MKACGSTIVESTTKGRKRAAAEQHPPAAVTGEALHLDRRVVAGQVELEVEPALPDLEQPALDRHQGQGRAGPDGPAEEQQYAEGRRDADAHGRGLGRRRGSRRRRSRAARSPGRRPSVCRAPFFGGKLTVVDSPAAAAARSSWSGAGAGSGRCATGSGVGGTATVVVVAGDGCLAGLAAVEPRQASATRRPAVAVGTCGGARAPALGMPAWVWTRCGVVVDLHVTLPGSLPPI